MLDANIEELSKKGEEPLRLPSRTENPKNGTLTAHCEIGVMVDQGRGRKRSYGGV